MLTRSSAQLGWMLAGAWLQFPTTSTKSYDNHSICGFHYRTLRPVFKTMLGSSDTKPSLGNLRWILHLSDGCGGVVIRDPLHNCRHQPPGQKRCLLVYRNFSCTTRRSHSSDLERHLGPFVFPDLPQQPERVLPQASFSLLRVRCVEERGRAAR